MSTLKVDTVQASTTNGSITIKGNGTGSVLIPSEIAYSANVTGNLSVTRSLAVGYTDGRVPQANLEVKGNAHITGATTIGGALTLGTDLAVAQGGTGASTFTDGGVLLGSGTGAITAMGVLSDSQMIVGDGTTDPVAESGDTLRNSIGVGSTASGTVMQIALANTSGNVRIARNLAVGYANLQRPGANLDVKGNAYISGATTIGDDTFIDGVLTLGTDLAVAQGGTGASTFTDGGVLLGSGTSAVTAMAVLTDGQMIVGDGTTDPVAESGATLRTSIGVGTGDSPQFTAVNIGAATDTTVARASAGDINVEGNLIYRAGGTDVPVADGGTGASTFTDGGVLLGSGTSAITAMGVLSDGQMIVGDGSTDPVAESGATLRTSVGVGTGDTPQFYGANVSGNVSINRSLAIGYTDGRVPQANLEVKGNAHIVGATTITGALTLGTDLAVAQGGTGASTFTDGGVLLGSGASAITAMAVLTDGQMIVGDGTTDPVAESGATLRTSIGVGTGDDVEFADVKSTGVILAADGAVDAPSITNTGDLNTGIWYPAADTIAISTGGAEALRISGVGQNATVSSHVVNHKGLSTANYTEYANNITNAGSSFTISTGTNISRYTLNVATCTITLPTGQPITPASMKTIILYLKQDGTGGRVVNFAAPDGEALEWNNSASEPEAVTGASKVTIYTFMKFHGDTNWYCSQSFIEN